MKKNSNGFLVILPDGRKGRTYHKESPVDEKIRVHFMDNNYEVTGQTELHDPKTLEQYGKFEK